LGLAATSRIAWLTPKSFPTSVGDSDEMILHYMSYVKGSTRGMCIFLIVVASWLLELNLKDDHPILWESLQLIRVLLSDSLSPEERLARAMGDPIAQNIHSVCLSRKTKVDSDYNQLTDSSP
jgi:hypothetical protein